MLYAAKVRIICYINRLINRFFNRNIFHQVREVLDEELRDAEEAKEDGDDDFEPVSASELASLFPEGLSGLFAG